MAGFLAMLRRLNTNQLGSVTGSDFQNGKLPSAYLGRGEKENKGKLMIYGEKLEDYVFGKEDVASCSVVQSDAWFKMRSNQQKRGPKYKVSFKDGKVAFICIPANDAYILENVIL